MLLQTRNLHFGAPWVTLTPTPKTSSSYNTRKNKMSSWFPSNSVISCSSTQLEMKKSENKIVKPLPAEVSRTIMELASVGTLSTLTQQGWPLGIGVRFAVDPDEGTPFFSSFNHIPTNNNHNNILSSLHVQVSLSLSLSIQQQQALSH